MAVTIPSGWATASSCMTSGDVWHWDDGATDVDVLGPPAETATCYPPDYTPTLGFAYAADACPDGFTAACATDYYSASRSTVCCPSGAYTFSCASVPFSSLTWGCSSAYTVATVLTITGVSLGSETTTTGAPYRAIRASGDQLLAWGVGISNTLSSTASSTSSVSASVTGTGTGGTGSTSTAVGASSSTASGAASGAGGLSSGASAGIGLGVGLGLILVAVGAWSVYRLGVKKKRRRTSASEQPSELKMGVGYELPGEQPPAELDQAGQSLSPQQLDSTTVYQPGELQGAQGSHELDATHKQRAELE